MIYVAKTSIEARINGAAHSVVPYFLQTSDHIQAIKMPTYCDSIRFVGFPVARARALTVLTIVCMLSPLLAFASMPIEISFGEKGRKQTGLHEIWHDPNDSHSLEEVQQAYLDGEFQPLDTAGSTGLKPGAFWSHFTLHNTTKFTQRLHLEYVDHQLIGLQAFEKYVSRDEYRLIANLSLNLPFRHRPIHHNRFVFEVTLPPGATREYLVKYSSDEKGFVSPSLRIWEPRQLRANHTFETSALAFLFGGFFLMSVFALVAGIATGEKTFYAYSIYSFSKITVWGTVLGFTHQYVMTEHFHWSYMSMSGAVSIICGLVFARIFLQTREHTPKLDYLLLFMLGNAIFLFVCALFKLKALAVTSITLALLLYPVLTLVGVIRWRQGSIEAAVFSFAWLLLVLGLVVQALRDIGLVEHNMLNYYWPPFASFSEMLTIMAAMGIKVQRLRQQKEQVEQQYTQQLEHSKAELENLVHERTKELEKAKSLAETEARTDPLTGIHNRRSFFGEADIRISLATRKQLPLSLLMIDIDHFKSINDTFGHSFGDEALKIFSQTIAKKIRYNDIFGRLGGEEFALLLSEGREGALELAERLRMDVEKIRIDTPEEPLTFTVSIGVAYLQPEDALENLIQKADKALYAAKASGRNQVIDYQQLSPEPTAIDEDA